MTPYEIAIVGIGVVAVVIAVGAWMAHVSVVIGKMLSELHAIADKLNGHLDWIRSLDEQVGDHERRIVRLEYDREDRRSDS